MVVIVWHVGKHAKRGARGASARVDRCHVVLELGRKGRLRTLWRAKSKWQDRGLVAAYRYEPATGRFLVEGGSRVGASDDIPFAVGGAPAAAGAGGAAAAQQGGRSRLEDVAEFVAECCLRDPDAQELAQELFGAWEAWRRAQGRDAASMAAFGRALGALGFGKARDASTGRIVRKGLRLRASRGEGPGPDQTAEIIHRTVQTVQTVQELFRPGGLFRPVVPGPFRVPLGTPRTTTTTGRAGGRPRAVLAAASAQPCAWPSARARTCRPTPGPFTSWLRPSPATLAQTLWPWTSSPWTVGLTPWAGTPRTASPCAWPC